MNIAFYDEDRARDDLWADTAATVIRTGEQRDAWRLFYSSAKKVSDVAFVDIVAIALTYKEIEYSVALGEWLRLNTP